MKKIILALILFSGFVATSQNASSYTTTTSQMRFNNPDLLQLYGAILGGAPSGTQTISGNIGGFTVKLLNTITTSASPDYQTGDCVGGVNTMTNAARSAGGSGVIQDVIIWDKDAQSPNLVIDYWLSSPAGTYTDNSAEVIAGDHAIWLGSVSISSGDFIAQGAVTRATISGVGLPFVTSGSANIYFTISTTSTINSSSTSEFVIRHGILQD